MQDNSHKSDPRDLWQSQAKDSIPVSVGWLRSKAKDRQSKELLESRVAIFIGLACSAFFAFTFTVARTPPAKLGWALLSLWGIYAAFYAYKWIRPEDLQEDATASTCLAFYKAELEKRQDHLRHRWWRSGMPVAIVAMALVIFGTGGQKPAPISWQSGLPFLLLLALWIIAFRFLRKRLGRDDIQKELQELRMFESQ